MRIIAGEFKSRLIKPPKNVNMRITFDKVKEALFDILGDSIIDSSFLDLFAGSGNVGIEALSRGAKEVIFVDNNKKCVETVECNLNSLGLLGLDNNQVVFMEAFKAVDKFRQQNRKFDLVFLDPPYYREIAKKSLNYISDCAILGRIAFVVVEHHKKDDLPQNCGKLTLFKSRSYGDIVLSFFKRSHDL